MAEWMVSAGLGFLAKLILGWIQDKRRTAEIKESGRAEAERQGRVIVEEIGNEQAARANAPDLDRAAILERLRQGQW